MWFIFVAFLISFFFMVLLVIRYCLASGMVIGYWLGALGMVISFPAIQNSHAVKRDCNAANDF